MEKLWAIWDEGDMEYRTIAGIFTTLHLAKRAVEDFTKKAPWYDTEKLTWSYENGVIYLYLNGQRWWYSITEIPPLNTWIESHNNA